MKRQQKAANAALSLLAGCVVGASVYAQGVEAGATAPDNASATVGAPEVEAPEMEYEPYFVPFLDPIWKRIHDAPIVAGTEPLFAPFDPKAGLSRSVVSSRMVARDARYAEVYAPVREVAVGDIVDLPLTVMNSRPVTSLRVFLDYDPAVVQPIRVMPAGIPTEDPFLNIKPDPEYIRNCPNCLITFTTLITPYAGDKPLLILRFRAVKQGTTAIKSALTEVSDDRLQMVTSIFHDGLIRVR